VKGSVCGARPEAGVPPLADSGRDDSKKETSIGMTQGKDSGRDTRRFHTKGHEEQTLPRASFVAGIDLDAVLPSPDASRRPLPRGEAKTCAFFSRLSSNRREAPHLYFFLSY
jgi:hypothetical protein